MPKHIKNAAVVGHLNLHKYKNRAHKSFLKVVSFHHKQQILFHLLQKLYFFMHLFIYN